MKKYQSHKIVEAAPIYGVDPSTNTIIISEAGHPRLEVEVPKNFFARGVPGIGDYLVRYQPDGYLSWSPEAVFEAGYALVEDAGTTWQERAKIEMEELADRAEKLRKSLIERRPLEGRITELLSDQYRGMCAYYDALVARLRLTGVVDGEVPTFARHDRGTPAAVEVTVTAPPGKRAEVCMDRAATTMSWTVVGGQSQTWSLMAGETIAVSPGEPHSTVAHKRDNG